MKLLIFTIFTSLIVLSFAMDTPSDSHTLSKSALKKQKKLQHLREQKAAKAIELANKQNEDKQENDQLDEIQRLSITPHDPEHTSLIRELQQSDIDTRVSINGWVHRIRKQGNMLFMVVRDGTGFLQCIVSGALAKSKMATALTTESTIYVQGTLKQQLQHHTVGGMEIQVDGWRLISLAPDGNDAFANQFNKKTGPNHLLNLRHLHLRADTPTKIMKVRAAMLKGFRDHFFDSGYTEVTAPALVQTQCEGGSTLFGLNYYGEDAYLTQSSQLYLETALPSLHKVWTIAPSFRAEKSLTRRHLSEYTHVEAEIPFIEFEELLTAIEDMIVDTLERTLAIKDIRQYVLDLNPEFQIPVRPFFRMTYEDAIEWLADHDVINEDTGEKYKFGEDIPEKPERYMTDTIGVPIILTHFPTEIKSFYMKKAPGRQDITESVDVLMPGVGEIVGGSMRISNLEELMAGYKREGIDPSPYYWFTDQRKYGSSEHGGWGLGAERFLAWLLKLHSVREACLYPRFMGRCKP